MTRYRLAGLIPHAQHIGLQHTLDQAAQLAKAARDRVKQIKGSMEKASANAPLKKHKWQANPSSNPPKSSPFLRNRHQGTDRK